jgi:Mg-chelatase subunit ChlD
LPRQAQSRRGNIIVLTAILLVVVLAMVAFAVDVGYMSVVSNEMRNSVDAAAMAGASSLGKGKAEAEQQALDYLAKNSVGTKTITSNDATVEFGKWNAASRTFSVTGTAPSAVRVTATSEGHSLFFGRALGTDAFKTTTKAVAIYRPRDIVLVLDYSGSMNTNKAIDDLKEAVQLFFGIMATSTKQDQVGLVIYSTDAELRSALTFDYPAVNKIVQAEKADGWTNIGDAMKLARKEIEKNGRPAAQKMMVVMTDGHTNKPDDKDPKKWVLHQADKSAEDGIELVTISFGLNPDKQLMEDVANKSPGYHFLVAGNVKQQEEEIKKVFMSIANNRTTVLVQ